MDQRLTPKTPGVNDFRGYHIHGHLCDGDCAILVAEGEPLESNHFGVLVNRLDVSGDRNLLVRLNEVLLLKSLLFEELLDTSVGDVLDHLLRERRGLLGGDGLDDLTGLLSLLWSDPTLGGVGLDVILAVNVGRIDADLLESGLDSLLNHLVLCLLDSELALLLNHLSRAVGRRDRDRVHSGDLLGNGLAELGRNLLVESDNGAEFSVEVNRVTDVRSLKSGIVSENVLLTGLAGLGGDLLLDSVTVRALAGLQAFDVGRE